MPRYWIVTCLDSRMVGGGLWLRWYQKKCVAIGWPPDKNTLEGPTGSGRWNFARTRMKKIRIGDKVIPFLKEWRIGPVGTITAVRVADDEWNPTLLASERKKGKSDDFGRRISVKWQEVGMPNDGRVALIPTNRIPTGPIFVPTGPGSQHSSRRSPLLPTRSTTRPASASGGFRSGTTAFWKRSNLLASSKGRNSPVPKPRGWVVCSS